MPSMEILVVIAQGLDFARHLPKFGAIETSAVGGNRSDGGSCNGPGASLT